VNVNSVVFIQDFSGFRMFGGVPAKVKEGISEFIKIKKDSYPELTAESIFVNVPKIFSLLFQTFKFVIPQRTLKKMTIIQSKRDVMLTLLEKIHPADLDDSFGGLFRCKVNLSDFELKKRSKTLLRPKDFDEDDFFSLAGGGKLMTRLREQKGDFVVLDTAKAKKHTISFQNTGMNGDDDTTSAASTPSTSSTSASASATTKKYKSKSSWMPSLPGRARHSKQIAAWEYRIIRLSDGVDVTDRIADISVRSKNSLGEISEIDFFKRENQQKLGSRFGRSIIKNDDDGVCPELQLTFLFHDGQNHDYENKNEIVVLFRTVCRDSDE